VYDPTITSDYAGNSYSNPPSIGAYEYNSGTSGTTVSTFTISGTISNLSGTVVLQDNAGDTLSKSANGSFTFATALNNNAPYNVTVHTQPSNQTCTVTNGSGTVSSANVTNITIACVNTATPLTSVSISGTLHVGTALTTTLAPGGATATYQWKRSTTSGGTYTNISGATSSSYTPVSGDSGYYLEVVATGTGSYTGTVTSSPTTAVTATIDTTPPSAPTGLSVI